MKLFPTILILFATLSCATVPPGTPATPVSTFYACSDTAMKTAANGILGAVATALATGNPEAALATLAASTSAAEVLCGVQLVVAELQTKASADKLAATELANGEAYLKAHAPAAK